MSVFAAVWIKDGSPHPGHLPLLGLHACERVIEIIRSAAGAPEAPAAIVAMLDEEDWRPNLVAATAVLFHPSDGRFADALWRALDDASWVSPQIAVVLSLHDPELVSRATERTERGCPISARRWDGRFEGHTNEKALSALRALLGDREVADEEGARIALHWRDRITWRDPER